MNKLRFFLILGIIIGLLIIAFAYDHSGVDNSKIVQYGFWNGIWHGMTAPFAFIKSLYREDISVWATTNNKWYIAGFILGLSTISRGTLTIKHKKKKID